MATVTTSDNHYRAFWCNTACTSRRSLAQCRCSCVGMFHGPTAAHVQKLTVSDDLKGFERCREAESGALTALSVCHGSQERSILVTVPGEVNITRVNEAVHNAMANLPKKSYTPGFFVAQAIRAADGHSTQHIPYDQKASGGFRDVGKHTTAEPLPTCWPLVEQVFHYFMQEARAPTTCLCHIRIHTCCKATRLQIAAASVGLPAVAARSMSQAACRHIHGPLAPASRILSCLQAQLLCHLPC